MAEKREACAILGCDRSTMTRGWCKPHYIRWWRYGDPLGGPLHTQRWVADVIVQSTVQTCITTWPFAVSGKGYPTMWWRGRQRYVSNVILELSGQPRPDPPNDLALHSCDVPMCLNSRHLRWGTNVDNMADMVARSRQPRGMRQGAAKLTDDLVRAIRAAARSGRSGRSLAAEHGLHHSTISSLLRGETWTHV